MKSLITVITLAASFSTFASDFCLATKEIIPYSPFAQINLDCNGVKIKETAFFGKGFEKKFEAKLKENKLNIIMKQDKRYLVSQKSKTEIDAAEICLGFASTGRAAYYIECNNGIGLSLDADSVTEFTNFLSSHNYTILQKPLKKNGYFVLSR